MFRKDTTWAGEGGFPVEEGMQVRALKRITETDFNDAEIWVHAEPGDTGEVADVREGDGIPTVIFDRSKTATVVFPHEIGPLNMPQGDQ
jgi:hypothetical protein